MTLSDVSIRNPVFAWMLMIGLIFFGFICFTRMGLSQMPDVSFPVVNVTIGLPNAAPEVIESDIADVVEQAVMGVEGVTDVQTTCTQGQASISVFLDISRNVDVAVQEVQTLVFSVEKQLPTNIYPPVIKKYDPNSSPIIWFAVSADPPLTEKDLMLFTRDHIKDKFTSLTGVSAVNLGGFMDREVNLWTDNKQLNAKQLTALDVISSIQHQHAEVPAGYMETPDVQYSIRMMGEAYSIPDFANLPILTRGGTPNYTLTRLRNIGSIEDGIVTPLTGISRFDGTPSVGLGLVMQNGYNAVKIADLAQAKMNQIVKQLPKGYHIAVNFDTTTFIRDNVHELEFTILLASILTSLVCYVFLGSWSSTLNVLLAIPTSLFGTFIVTYFFGFTLNTFTLMALSLSIGVVVDDAIMVLENIVRHQEKGEDQVEAALVGAREITFAAMATSLAIVAIFLPIAFMTGVIGKFFFQFGITISGAVMISLLEAITLTPMRCAEFVHKADEHTPFNHFVNTQFGHISDFYKSSLEWSLKFRWAVVLIALGIFVLSLFTIKYVKKDFVPSTDMGVFIVNLKLPVQYSLNHTDQLIRQCEDQIKARGEVKHLYSAVGGLNISVGQSEAVFSPNTASFFVTMKDQGDRPTVKASEKETATGLWAWAINIYRNIFNQHLSQQEFASWCRKTITETSPEIAVSIQDLSMQGWSAGKGYTAELLVTGPDWATLEDSVVKIRQALHASPKLADVDDNFLNGQPELRVIPDRVKSAEQGVNMDDLGNVIAATIGAYQFQGTYFHEGGHDNYIAMRVPTDQRKGPDSIKDIYVRNNRGEVLPTSDVADLKIVPSLQQIPRDMRQRAVFFYANPGPGVSQQECLDEAVRICKSILPQGYNIALTGSSQSNSNSLSQLLFVMILGIAVAYMVLGSQFNSFIHPIVVLLALPFSVTGAFFSLLITGQALSIYSMVGIILLMGLVKKNSIMLVDFTNQRRAEGMDVHEALLAACPIRLRPILMTSFATIAGAVPAALSLGPGAELRQPMSIAIIGGILFSTFLTLLVVPCAYSLMSNLENRKAHHATGYENYAEEAKRSKKKTKKK
jgi:hydrophobe/amphiphile efflux-1 (HAE1) family protein